MAEEGHKPGSVPRGGYPPRGDDHSSRTAVADGLKQPDPGASDGPPSNAPLFGLAPDGVYRAADVAIGTGELLPHPFTLTRLRQRLRRAVYSLWHFPWGCPRFPLGTILSCGARTFLPLVLMTSRRPPVLLRPSSKKLFLPQRRVLIRRREISGDCNAGRS